MASFGRILAEAKVVAAPPVDSRGEAEFMRLREKCTVRSSNGYLEMKSHSESGALEYGIIVAQFAEGRNENEQRQIASRLDASEAAAFIRSGMMAVLEELLAGDEGFSVARAGAAGPYYYMLCDDEEVGTMEDGSMDGDLRLRASRAAWRMVAVYTPQDVAVEFVGFAHGPGPVEGAALLDSGGGMKRLYNVVLGEIRDEAPHADVVKKIIEIVAG